MIKFVRKKSLNILVGFLCLYACTDPVAQKRQELDAQIAAQLSHAPRTDSTFLGLKYGEHHSVTWRKLLERQASGELEDGTSGPQYRFSEPAALRSGSWAVRPTFYNDSLERVVLYQYDGQNGLYYEPLLEKYQAVYGPPIKLEPLHAYFVKGEQVVEINATETLFTSISYSNSRRDEHRINHFVPTIRQDENEYDSAYYKKYVLPTLKANPDKI